MIDRCYSTGKMIICCKIYTKPLQRQIENWLYQQQKTSVTCPDGNEVFDTYHTVFLRNQCHIYI